MRSRGLMDKALASGAGDCGFESHRDRPFIFNFCHLFCVSNREDSKVETEKPKKQKVLLRVGFEPTPFRTRTLIWRLRPTRPSQPLVLCFYNY